MNIKTVAKLFKEPAQWPLIPPWWLLPSPQAAALLNIKPATLQSWRIRGEGPEPVPPMYLLPTQGDPMYYRYGDIREWAASSLGMAFPLEEQCRAFLQDVDPKLSKIDNPMDSLARCFDYILQFERERIKNGLEPLFWDLNMIEMLDTYYSKQPRFRPLSTKPVFCGPFECDIHIPTEELCHILPA